LAAALCALVASPPGASAEAPESFWTRCAANSEEDLSCGLPRGIGVSPLDGSVYVSDQSNKRVVQFSPWSEFLRTFGGGVVTGGAEGSGDLNETITVSNVTTTKKSFEVGRLITGEGIAPGTKIAAVGTSTITLSQPATESKTGVILTVAEGAGNVPVNELQTVTVPAAASGTYSLKFKTTLPSAEPSSAPIAVGAPAEGAGSVQEALGALANVGAANVGVSGPTIGGSGESIYTVEFKGARFADTDVAALSVASQPSGGTVTIATTRPGASSAEICEAIAECRAGVEGTGAGQLGPTTGAQGIAVDSIGNVYLVDRNNQRVQKFDAEGHFLRTWGKGVNSGTSGNADLCTNAGSPTDLCKAGEVGTAAGQFGNWTIIGSYIAVDTKGTESAADDTLYIGDQGRIQTCSTEGFCTVLPDPEGLLVAKKVSGLAVVPSGNLFVARESTANLLKLNATTGAKECEGTIASPEAIAADSAGNAYAVEGTGTRTVRKFSSSCAEVTEEAPSAPFFPTYPFVSGFTKVSGIAINEVCWDAPAYDLYLSKSVTAPNGALYAYGPAPEQSHFDICPPIPQMPEIESQGALAVEADRATVQAKINPHQWANTSYYVQFATAACIEGPDGWESACVKRKPTSSELQLGAGPISSAANTAKVLLTGLSAATDYRYRFVAQSRFDESEVEVNDKGGPVFGVGGTESEEGKEAAFTTTEPEPGVPPCPANQAFRIGAGSLLPDCRAYEMVSPVDKNGDDLRTGRGGAYAQISPDANRITYTTKPAFGDQPSSKVFNQYLASRDVQGWRNSGINLPLGRQLTDPRFSYPVREVEAFTDDLCNELLVDYNFTPLDSAGQKGYANLYRQSLCGAEEWEALTRVPLPPETAPDYVGRDSVQGFSADLGHILFVAAAKLTSDASSELNDSGFPVEQVYDFSNDSLFLVSLLPAGGADAGSGNLGAEVGGGLKGGAGGNLEHAVSDDGSHVYWTGAANNGIGPLYLRTNPAAQPSPQLHGSAVGTGDLSGGSNEVLNASATQGAFAAGQTIRGGSIPFGTTIVEVSGSTLTLSAPAGSSATGVSLEAFSECTEAAKACTVPVSKGGNSVFWSATPDGEQALFSEGDIVSSGAGQATLYRFDAATQTRTQVATAIRGMLGASEDLSRIYYVSTDALTGGQENDFGDKAQPGEPNLYLDEEGQRTFVGTLLDGEGGDLSGEQTVYRLGSVNPRYNTARVTPDGAHLAFQARAPLTHFDNTDAVSGETDTEVFAYEAGGELHCVSCRASGERPSGADLPQADLDIADPTGVWGAAWIPGWTHPLHPSQALSNDGKHLFFNSLTPLVSRDTNSAQDVYEWEAPGTGGCSEGSSAFHASNGGCVYLISSGESPRESLFVDASPEGHDVFFTTASSLLPQDPGLIDLYDARVGGGFPQPVVKGPCEGEACANPPPPPNDPTPSSSAYQAAEPPPACRKGKVRRKGRCVAKKRHGKGRRGHRSAAHRRRTGR
jgi:hypothetical protein